MIPAITYFRTGRHYHRPRELNCRVRNGNECGLLGKVTGKSQVRHPLEGKPSGGRIHLRKTVKIYKWQGKSVPLYLKNS